MARALLLPVGLLAIACGSQTNGNGKETPAIGTGGTSSADGAVANAGARADSGSAAGLSGFHPSPSPSSESDAGAGCTVTASAETALAPVYLAFAFDVSASMGKLDKPYNDPTKKWDPVVAASKAFFSDPLSSGISASLTFFPNSADKDTRCDVKSYANPDVPMTALPSDAFGNAIDTVTPKTSSDWLSGTPTLAVLTASVGFISPLKAADPSSNYAIVLVSDGYPQGCSDNAIDSVASEVSSVAATIPTYVIGVANPPGGPDTVTNLNDIAKAGGTKQAFIIQTGDPQQTETDFQTAVRGIQQSTISCSLAIPTPPDGLAFDATLANVTYSTGDVDTALTYDADCETNDAWRYDDPAAPTQMILCDTTCAIVQSDPKATLRVDFGCSRRDVPQ